MSSRRQAIDDTVRVYNPTTPASVSAAYLRLGRFDPMESPRVFGVAVLVPAPLFVLAWLAAGWAAVALLWLGVGALFVAMVGGVYLSGRRYEAFAERHRLSLYVPPVAARAHRRFGDALDRVRCADADPSVISDIASARPIMNDLLVRAADLHPDLPATRRALDEVVAEMTRISDEAVTLALSKRGSTPDPATQHLIDAARTVTIG